ncbi:tRNA (guanine(10)-N2)-methyltransferase homolog [Panonychus citri]|uniref:tRNA (guanine(10)-N2)-methyltransferase homolog n=1 Tax=Panonychus citri TaxID=50023 RepID=UPI0023083626|nr:tRNA (guanine(10)-N2)-methyltransferase homolog [Panonychus citri]
MNYLIWFCQESPAFRLAEIKALLTLFNCNVKLSDTPKENPFLIVKSDTVEEEEKLIKAASRAVCVRSLFHLWSHSSNREDLISQLKQCDLIRKKEFTGADRSFKITVQTYGKKITSQLKVDKIEQLSFLPFEGPINLTEPDNHFYLIEYFGLLSNSAPKEPYDIFFGRFLTNGDNRFSHDVSLKKRKFISNTSMVPWLTAVMANLGFVKDGDIVYDPFVGSGSLLVAAAKYGAFTIGSDIDYKLLHGERKPSRRYATKRDPDESVYANFQQYGLTSNYLDVFVADASRSPFRPFEVDAIITDPPYGIRENSRKIGTDKYDETYKVPEEYLNCHYPSKVLYPFEDIMRDLFRLALKNLRIGGRLVFWIPRITDYQMEDSLPNHPSFRLVDCCNQDMKFNVSRVLVSYEKISNDSNCQVFIPEIIKNFRELYLEGMAALGLKNKEKIKE